MTNDQSLLIYEEVQILDKTVDMFNEFSQMKCHHPNERMEFVNAIHQIQNIMSCRIVRKILPGVLNDPI